MWIVFVGISCVVIPASDGEYGDACRFNPDRSRLRTDLSQPSSRDSGELRCEIFTVGHGDADGLRLCGDHTHASPLRLCVGVGRYRTLSVLPAAVCRRDVHDDREDEPAGRPRPKQRTGKIIRRSTAGVIRCS